MVGNKHITQVIAGPPPNFEARAKPSHVALSIPLRAWALWVIRWEVHNGQRLF